MCRRRLGRIVRAGTLARSNRVWAMSRGDSRDPITPNTSHTRQHNTAPPALQMDNGKMVTPSASSSSSSSRSSSHSLPHTAMPPHSPVSMAVSSLAALPSAHPGAGAGAVLAAANHIRSHTQHAHHVLPFGVAPSSGADDASHDSAMSSSQAVPGGAKRRRVETFYTAQGAILRVDPFLFAKSCFSDEKPSRCAKVGRFFCEK